MIRTPRLTIHQCHFQKKKYFFPQLNVFWRVRNYWCNLIICDKLNHIILMVGKYLKLNLYFFYIYWTITCQICTCPFVLYWQWKNSTKVYRNSSRNGLNIIKRSDENKIIKFNKINKLRWIKYQINKDLDENLLYYMRIFSRSKWTKY